MSSVTSLSAGRLVSAVASLKGADESLASSIEAEEAGGKTGGLETVPEEMEGEDGSSSLRWVLSERKPRALTVSRLAARSRNARRKVDRMRHPCWALIALDDGKKMLKPYKMAKMGREG
jgi:hypothetical protein